MKLTPTHGVEHHIHNSQPPVFAKSRCLDPEKLQITKAEFRRLESASIIHCSISPWASPLHMVPKKDRSWRLSPKFDDNPRKVSFAKHARPFQWLAWLHSVFKNRSCQGLSPNPCSDGGHPKNCNHYAIWLI